MRADAKDRGRFLRLFGSISFGVGALLAFVFTVLAIAAALPPFGTLLGLGWVVMGLTLYLIGARSAAQTVRVFERGAAATGEIVAVEKNRAIRMNGRNPWEVRYRFATDTRQIIGKARFWDDAMPETREGERVSIVYDPDNPTNNALWTRVRAIPRPLEASSGARIEGIDPTRIASPAESAEADDLEAAEPARSSQERVEPQNL